jgi:uncharacterized protein YjbI with pentapeptide repeats
MASDQNAPETERRFSQEQYDFLRQCSKKGEDGIKEWNQWRRENPNKDILLEGAPMRSWNLSGVHFSTQESADSGSKVYLAGADFWSAHLGGAKLHHAYLTGARFNLAHLQHADLHDAHVEGTVFFKSRLPHANMQTLVVGSKTSFWKCEVSPETDFEGTALGNVRVDPATKQLLEYNIRRKNWEQWYVRAKRDKPSRLRWCITSPVRLFWVMSDYGRSTGRIILSFLILSFVFAVAYCLWPSMLKGLTAGSGWRRLLHCLYFSVVTMTTLGFGDIAANPDSWQGQVLLMVQVILGYVLLGALVTRLAVLFTAGGPAGRFSKSGDDEPD